MSAWMYREGTHVEANEEKCQQWLERAVEKGYAPAMNDLAVILLGEADRFEGVHPELKADAKLAQQRHDVYDGDRETALKGSEKRVGGGLGMAVGNRRDENDGDEEEGVVEDEGEGGGGESGNDLPPEKARIFEQIMERRKRSMRLLQDAAKTGHTDAMTNLGNMQEAMGYYEDARNWYRYDLSLGNDGSKRPGFVKKSNS